MKSVNISVLKAQLSAHIQLVRRGEEVLICDRNKPVARIIPCSSNDYAEQQQRLVARGTLVPPQEVLRVWNRALAYAPGECF